VKIYYDTTLSESVFVGVELNVRRGIPWAKRIFTDYCHINPMYTDEAEVRKIIR